MGLSKANITNEDGKFVLSYESDDGKTGGTEKFDTFAEASKRLSDVEADFSETPELPASETTPEMAEEINSNVNPAPAPAGATVGGESLGQDESNDNGAGNREAPHPTKEEANDSDGRAD